MPIPAQPAEADPLYANARVADSSAIAIAREDCTTFCELILTDEETGDYIQCQPMHEEWHELADCHKNLIIWTFPECGKTQQLAIARVIWLLGRDPRGRYAILSATTSQAEKIIRAIKGHIEANPMVIKIFKDLMPGDLWRDNQITIKRPAGIKDPSIQAYSPEGGSIQGARLDGLIIDDVLTSSNTRTRYQREKVSEWIRSSAFSRLGENAWVLFLTNAWHPDDLPHQLEKEGGWVSRRYPVLIDGKSAWPARWPLHRIEMVRTERFGPLEFTRQMMCQARDESVARFKRSWIERCLELGEGYSTYRSLEDLLDRDPELADDLQLTPELLKTGGLPEGVLTVTGVDLAVSRSSSADLSVVFNILGWPDGTRQVLSIRAGHWAGPEIVNNIISAHERFRSIVVVENNAAQDFILQWARERAPGMRIIPFTTGRNKLSVEYGVESLAAELEAGRWLIPCSPGTQRTERQISDWIDEMMQYDPRSHTGDRLMAAWIAREFLRRMQMRLSRRRRGGTRVLR